jgi:hypothetical protein
MPREGASPMVARRRRERFTPELQAVRQGPLGQKTAAQGFAGLDHYEDWCRSRGNSWPVRQNLKLERPRNLETADGIRLRGEQSGDVEVFSPIRGRTADVPLATCFNCGGDSPPSLLVRARPQCALEELASLQERSPCLDVNLSGWVTRRELRGWCRWLLDVASTQPDLKWMRLIAADHIGVVTFPHSRPTSCSIPTSLELARSTQRLGDA